MPSYKDPTNQVHWLDSDSHAHLLPPGSVLISDEEAAALVASTLPSPDYSALRAAAYREESDPLFFQEQRGEVPAGTWLAKVNEIKARWPL